MVCRFFKTILLTVLIGPIVPGTFNGIVLDSKTQEPIVGATVIVGDIDLGIGAYTDMDGEFFIDSIQPGRHMVTVRCIGYEVNSYSIRVRDGVETNSKIIMDPSIESVPILAKESGGTKEEAGPGNYARGFGLILDTSGGASLNEGHIAGGMRITFPVYKEGAIIEPEISYSKSSTLTRYQSSENIDSEETSSTIFISIGMFRQYMRTGQKAAFYMGLRGGLSLSTYDSGYSTSSDYDNDVYILHAAPTLGAQYFITNRCSFGGEVRYIFTYNYEDGYPYSYDYEYEEYQYSYDTTTIRGATSLRFLLRYYF